jgi:hypothetical protein
VGATSAIGKRLERALGYSGSTILLEEPKALNTDTLQKDEAAAKAEADQSARGLGSSCLPMDFDSITEQSDTRSCGKRSTLGGA